MTLFLKCDADGCGHREDVEALSEELVGKACPECGANLLTQQDYEDWLNMQPVVSMLKALEAISAPLVGREGAGAVRVTLTQHNKETKLMVNPHKDPAND